MTTESAQDTPTSPRQRLITPRRGLPSGRAVGGAALVAVAFIGAFATAGGGDDRPDTSWAVAVRPIERGATITASDVDLHPIDLPAPVADRSFTTADELVGAVAISPIESGELVHRGHIALAFDGVDGPSLEFSFPIARSRAPRTLRAGDSIALLATTGAGDGATTSVIVAEATVIAFDVDDSGPASRTTAVLTVAIAEPDEQLAAAHAAQTADLTVIRTTKSGEAALPTRHPATTSAADADAVAG